MIAFMPARRNFMQRPVTLSASPAGTPLELVDQGLSINLILKNIYCIESSQRS
jgi:hypothetical protein